MSSSASNILLYEVALELGIGEGSALVPSLIIETLMVYRLMHL